MKNITILISAFLFSLFSSNLFSQHVEESTAKLVAKNFMFERIDSEIRPNYDNLKVESIIPIGSYPSPCLYAVNLNVPGYVIVSSSKNTLPVLAYSFQGRYTAIDIPPAMNLWLKSYEDQISKENTVFLPGVEKEWMRLTSEDPKTLKNIVAKGVEPLITTTWNQGTFYNEMCPADPQGPSGHCYTGCVATAMGQVVNYFRWPVSGTGSYSYNCPPYGTLSADFANTTYSWDEMPLYVTTSNPPIAELLYHLGVSVDMVYGPNGSGMYNHKAAYSLRTYFKYSPETQYVYRDSTTMDWDSLLISHLDRHIPMYYAGWSVPNVNGHAFVCDGYQDGNYYHFNWGWGGSYDGYFYTDNLTPGGSNFNLAQELLINAVPDTTQYSYPVLCQGNKTSETIEGTIDDGSGPLYNYENNAQCSWLIDPSDSVNLIEISFQYFSTENSDVLRIYDGEDDSAPLLSELSGDTLPNELISSGDKVYITFDSDGTTTGPGWLLSYISELPVYCAGMQTLTEPSGEFSDGSGRMNYHNGTSCIWVIDPEGDQDVLIIEFSEFNTEGTNDIVNIYDYYTQELLANYSGEYIAPDLPPPVIVESQKAYITFTTNASITAPGWTANYFITPTYQVEKQSLLGLYVYPNPVEDQLNISFYSEIQDFARYTLRNIEGKIIFNGYDKSKAGRNNMKINLSEIDGGVYFLSIQSSDKSVVKKVVIL